MSFPGESTAYRAARDKLLQDEIELRRAMERVAVSRRALPTGGAVPQDYVFDEMDADGKVMKVKFSELFAAGRNSLVIYNFMFPRHPVDQRPGPDHGETAKLDLKDTPCPSCVAFLDQLEGAAPHVVQQTNLVIVAKTGAERLATFAKERGWRYLRLVSSAHNSFKRDYGAEMEDGHQQPMANVFHRDADGVLRHFWSTEMLYAPTDPGQDQRHVGTLEPLWNILDLTPEGRPDDWDEQMSYGGAASESCCCE
jgi:predicted dithiol-disulfide oxidoreductase (DUF899 family)